MFTIVSLTPRTVPGHLLNECMLANASITRFLLPFPLPSWGIRILVVGGGEPLKHHHRYKDRSPLPRRARSLSLQLPRPKGWRPAQDPALRRWDQAPLGLPPPQPATLGPASRSAAHTSSVYLSGILRLRHASARRPPPGHRNALTVRAGPASRMRRSPIRRAASPSNRFESLR